MTPPSRDAPNSEATGSAADNYTLGSCDIFCAVIDNYGDIGVCWRLARQLAHEYGARVRLWVDNLAALQRIWPSVNSGAVSQYIDAVEVRHWLMPFADAEPAALVIEAFGCQLPQNYIEVMARQTPPPVWLNLEYLSAEVWVDDCHGLRSPYAVPLPVSQPAAGTTQPCTLDKYFFFPGFSARTGGLLRERDLLQRRRSFQDNFQRRAEFLTRLGVPNASLFPAPALTVSLFAYENKALPALLAEWQSSPRPILCLVPEGRSMAVLADFFAEPALAVGSCCRRGALTVVVLPFLTQDDYDCLLWSCDLNLVRGEDSFVRAQWAARPLFWQIYPQQDGAHWPKLEAFLDLYSESLPAPAETALRACWRAWNGDGDIAVAWRELAPHLEELSTHARRWCGRLAEQGNLAAALVQFCANHV